MEPLPAHARAFHQAGQEGEYRRRVAARGRRFPDGEADFPLGHGQAGGGIHHQHDVPAQIAEIFGHRGGHLGGLDAHQGGLIGSGDDDDRTGQARLPRSFSRNSFTSRPRSPMRAMTFTALWQLRAIMPSNTDLPTPEPANRPTRWPLPMVLNPSMARMPVTMGSADAAAVQGIGGIVVDAPGFGQQDGPLPVDRFPEPVDDAAQERLAHAHGKDASGGHDFHAGPQAVQLAQRHQQGGLAAEAHHFGLPHHA